MTEPEKKSTRVKEVVDYKKLDAVGKSSPAKVSDVGAIPKVLGFSPMSPSYSTGKKPTNTLSLISDSFKSPDEEKSFLQEKLKAFDDKMSRLKEEKEIESLRQQLVEKEREFLDLEKSMTTQKKPTTSASSRDKGSTKKGTSLSSIDINDLRSMKNLKNKARKQLKKCGLVESSDSSSDSGSSIYSSGCDSDSASVSVKSKNGSSKSKHKLKKKSSGLTAKASESIKNRQRFPHAHLRFDFASTNMSFDKLDFNLFVAGELEIISDIKTGNLKRKGRLELLKKLMYLSNSYEFTIVKSLYAAVLREVELGHLDWGEDFSYVESAVLTKNKIKSKGASDSVQFRPKPSYSLPKEISSSSAENKVWYCQKFQSNKCSQKTSHAINVKGKSRFAKHMCATCYLADKKELAHPECSTACPHQNN